MGPLFSNYLSVQSIKTNFVSASSIYSDTVGMFNNIINMDTIATSTINTNILSAATLLGGNLSINGNSTIYSSLSVNGFSNFKNNVLIEGNLTIMGNGTNTIINTNNLEVKDNIIFFAKDNRLNDNLPIGFIGQYFDSSNNYTGLIRNRVDKKWWFINNVTTDISNDYVPNLVDTGSIVAKDIYINDISSNNANINYITSNLISISNNSYFNNLDVSGTLRNNISYINSLSVNSILSSSISISQTAFINTISVSSSYNSSNLSVAGITYLSNLDVSGTTSLNNTLSVSGTTSLSNLDVSGTTSLNNTLSVYGSTSLYDLDVSGTTSLHNTLSVADSTYFKTFISVGTNGYIDGDLTVIGNLYNSSQLYFASFTNILSMTDPSYNDSSANFAMGTGTNITTYGNIIETIINRGSYLYNTGLKCGSVIDTSLNRFNITSTGLYKFTVSIGIIAFSNNTNNDGNGIFEVFINGSQYSNSPTNTVLWCRRNLPYIYEEHCNIVHFDYLCRLYNGDYIDVRARQELTSNVISYSLCNGATIELTKIN
jgi:hypothetical protein